MIFPDRVGPNETVVLSFAEASAGGEGFGDDFGDGAGVGDSMAILVFLGCDAFEVNVCCWEIRYDPTGMEIRTKIYIPNRIRDFKVVNIW